MVVHIMGKIKIMNEFLANKIAAGEVVEKCVSVVKELVENSIDAMSKEIKIELIDAGVREIKITDDGLGMEKEDALLAFSRHATSKLLDEDDLFRINSLGFRGEALPSIASVSDVVLKTSTGEVGTLVNIKGGKLISEERADARIGTVISVKNLFYNTPARLKHLRSLHLELANIVDYIHKVALSYPNIKFSLYNNSKILFNTDGSNNLLKVINNIYGIEITKKMIEIKGANNDYLISGYISYPEITKSTRNSIITIVNGRIVRNLELNKLINDSYHTYKQIDRYPIVILNINVDPSLVDVNIHPTKMDIKFSKMDKLKELLEELIKKELSNSNLIPNVVANKKEEIKFEEYKFELEREINNIAKNDFINERIEEYKLNDEPEKILNPVIKTGVPELYPIGLIHGTYIVCQNELGMYLIDQHAGEERINYEKYLGVLGNPIKNNISLLIPIIMEFSSDEFIILNENLHILRNLNFDIEQIGVNTIIIREHPMWLPKNYEDLAIRKIIEIIINKESFNIEKFNENVAINLSCKLAIKANKKSTIEEMEQLINALRKCNNPFTCPHGRPVIVFYSDYELAKMFKRIG